MSEMANKVLRISGLLDSGNQDESGIYRLVLEVLAECENQGLSITGSNSVDAVMSSLYSITGSSPNNHYHLDRMAAFLNTARDREAAGRAV